MCGIYGAFGASAARTRDARAALSGILRHRGPDDEGFEADESWALGFRRLSILDLTASGHQPMTTPDGQHWLVFNGEIYNYVELRDDLQRAGERFTGTSDTEVLLRLLARDGVACLQRLNGMFAFAYVNTITRRFLLARDRLGVKPLYVFRDHHGLRFASELKGLLAWPDAPREIDMAALAEYMALNYLPSEQCIFKGYGKLGAAEYLVGSIDRPVEATTHTYWSVELNDDSSRFEISRSELDELEQLVSDATRIRLRSDVPIGVFLSGGIDSGVVAAVAARDSAAKQLLALTVAFDAADYDETALAAETAGRTGLPQRIVHQAAGGLDMIDELAWFFDEPFGDPSALPTYMLCKAAAEHATVFLSGDGGDEAFGGYRRYIEAQRHQRLATLLRPLRGAVSAATAVLPRLSPVRYRLAKAALPDDGFAAAFDCVPSDPILQLIEGDALHGMLHDAGGSLWRRWRASRGHHLLARQQQLDLSHYLPDDVLVKVDRASMAHSLEVRSPFLDYRLVEWAARLPRTVMMDSKAGKRPLRRLAARLLPPSVVNSHKRGFGVPLDQWFRRTAHQTFVADRLLSRRALERGWWTAAGVRAMLEGHANGHGRPFGFLIWRLLMLDAWARIYVDDSSIAGPPCPVRARADRLCV